MSNRELIKTLKSLPNYKYLNDTDLAVLAAEGLEAAEEKLAAAEAVIEALKSNHRTQSMALYYGVSGTVLAQTPTETLRAVKEAVWDECLDAIEQNELNTDQAREGNPYREETV